MAEKRKNGPHGPGGPGPRDFRKPKNAGRTISTLLGYVGKSKWLLGVVAVCLVLNVGCSIGGSYMLRPLINDCIIPGDYPRLARMLAVLAGIYVCAALLSYTYARIMVHVSQRTTHAIRQDLFAKMQRLPLSYFDTHTHGELMSRYTNDIETITEILNNGMISLISGGLTFIGVVAMMLYLSPALFLVSVFSMGLMMVVVMTVGRRSRRYFSAQQRDLGVINGYIEEMIEGQKVIKVFTHERAAKAGFDVRNEAYRRSAVNAQSFAGAMMPAMGNLSHINYALTCCAGALLSIAMGLDLGSLVVYLQYTRQFSQPISQMSQQVNNLLAAIAGAERVFEVMETAPEIDEGRVTLVRDGSGWAWKKPDGALVPLRGDVRFQDVVFRYVPEKAVLQGISLYAKPGQKIAFVGSTGAGKTTITNLINRFYEIESGLITYDGIDVRDIRKESLRRSLGIRPLAKLS